MTVCITFSETGSYGEYDPAYVTVECPDKIEINAVYTEHPEATVGTTNDAQTLEIQVDKVDENGSRVGGATFGLYANCTILDGDGNVLFHAGEEYGIYDNSNGYWVTYATEGAETTITNSLSRTGSITVKKLDADGSTLSGVEFTLYAAATMTDAEASAAGITKAGQEYTEGGVTCLTAYSGGTWYIYGGTGQVRTTGTDGTVSWEDLEAGSYVVKETKAADGYTLLADALCIDLPLTVSDEEVSEKGYDTSGENTVHLKSKGQWLFYDLTYEVTDGWNLSLPSTGWKGMVPAAVTAAGLAIVAAAMAVTLRRKKGNGRKPAGA